MSSSSLLCFLAAFLASEVRSAGMPAVWWHNTLGCSCQFAPLVFLGDRLVVTYEMMVRVQGADDSGHWYIHGTLARAGVTGACG